MKNATNKSTPPKFDLNIEKVLEDWGTCGGAA